MELSLNRFSVCSGNCSGILARCSYLKEAQERLFRKRDRDTRVLRERSMEGKRAYVVSVDIIALSVLIL